MICGDWIHIRDLSLHCIVGVHDFERLAPRPVMVQVSMNVDLANAGKSDILEHTVNYDTICNHIIHFVEASKFNLIESLADGVATICLKEPAVLAVRVQVEKPGALMRARTVCAEILRVKAGHSVNPS